MSENTIVDVFKRMVSDRLMVTIYKEEIQNSEQV